MGSVSKIN